MTTEEGSTSGKGLTLKGAAPGYTVNDVEASLAFYRDILGFQVGDRWEMDGKLMGVELKAGDVLIMLGQDDWQKGRDRVKGEGVRMYFSTNDDIDAFAAEVKSKGVQLTSEPKDQSWGMRDFALVDPDGYKLTFAADLKK